MNFLSSKNKNIISRNLENTSASVTSIENQNNEINSQHLIQRISSLKNNTLENNISKIKPIKINNSNANNSSRRIRKNNIVVFDNDIDRGYSEKNLSNKQHFEYNNKKRSYSLPRDDQTYSENMNDKTKCIENGESLIIEFNTSLDQEQNQDKNEKYTQFVNQASNDEYSPKEEIVQSFNSNEDNSSLKSENFKFSINSCINVMSDANEDNKNQKNFDIFK